MGSCLEGDKPEIAELSGPKLVARGWNYSMALAHLVSQLRAAGYSGIIIETNGVIRCKGGTGPVKFNTVHRVYNGTVEVTARLDAAAKKTITAEK